MKFKKFPVLDMSEFKTVCVDAIQWEDGTYSVMLAFFKNFAHEKKRARGFVMNTYMGGETLHEVYHKISAMFILGLFNGTELSAQGTLYNQSGEKIDDICWNEFSDEIDDVDITDEIISETKPTLH